jgi:hypothetical protein
MKFTHSAFRRNASLGRKTYTSHPAIRQDCNQFSIEGRIPLECVLIIRHISTERCNPNGLQAYVKCPQMPTRGNCKTSWIAPFQGLDFCDIRS